MCEMKDIVGPFLFSFSKKDKKKGDTMSLLKAKLNGTTVWSELGEELRRKDLRCPYCDAKLKIRHFPQSAAYYFACNEGEVHTAKACEEFQKYNRNTPALYGTSPDSFFEALSLFKEDEESGGKTGGNGGGTGGGTGTHRISVKPAKARSLEHLIKSGMLSDGPFERTYMGETYRNIDYVVKGEWAKYIWRVKKLVEIGARAVEAKWFGTLDNLGPDLKQKVKNMANQTAYLWFSRSVKIGGTNYYVRFCVDCDAVYLKIKRKFFVNKYNDKGSMDEFVIREIENKNKQMIVLVGAYRWVPMYKNNCDRDCPLYKEKCNNCLGYYKGIVSNVDQIVLMPEEKRD